MTTTLEPGTLDPYRLPRHTLPTRYDVSLVPDLAAASFTGTVTITLDTHEVVDSLVLNAIELDIHSCAVDGEPAAFDLDPVSERLFVRLAEPVDPGEHRVAIAFTGVLNDKLRGFYRSTYHDADGNERVIATTQMQATDCRRAFPCWDEPDFKAVFSITLTIEPDLLAVSNGPEVERTVLHSGKVAVRFADTMPMSSYLVAFVVGPLEATDPVDVGGVPMRIVHVPGKGHLTGFGLEIGAFALAWFQDYYAIAYPSDKVDLLALPDFAAGAMENLGCITFRENLLLVDPATATQVERQLVADVVAHELAHMWFGDLVTMRWWNGIWLNEAFATFMEIAACDAFRPEWNRWTAFGLERSAAFETDSLASTRSVEYEVRSPHDCEGMFDVLTYQKGGALLRMLEQYLGAERFRRGVSHYLRTHEYGNTETSDLWDAIEDTSDEPVRRMMDSWIWQQGYPVISVRAEGGELVLSQRRFTFDLDDASTQTWVVPVALRDHRTATTTTVLLDGDEIRVPRPAGAVVANAGGHGFFRVSYSDELREQIDADVLATMTTLEKYNLVDDAWNAVVAGWLDATEFVDLVGRFEDERELEVWQAILIGLRAVGRQIGDDEAARDGFRSRVAALVSPALDSLGEPAPGEPELAAKLRGVLLAAKALLGADDAARARSREYYARWKADPTSIDAELAAAATTVVAAIGDDEVYAAFLDRAINGVNPQEQLRHLYALAEFGDEALVLRTCELAMTDAVRTQNAPFLLRACVANRDHGAAAWEFLRRHWDQANARFPSNTIVRMVEAVKLLDAPAQVVDIHAFFSEHPIPQAAKTLDQILERQSVNAATRERNHAALKAYFTG